MNNWTTIPQEEVIQKTAERLKEHNVEPIIVETGNEALERIKSFIPQGASAMNGSSVTLEQIGYLDYLKKNEHGWNDLHQTIKAENNKEKRAALRRQSVLSDYYLGSVHALTEEGEFLIASNTGSQLPHVVFTSPNLIFVVGAQKIVSNLTEGLERVEDYVYPLENKHLMDQFNIETNLSKIVIFKKERPKSGRTVRMIIVKEHLGY